MQVRFLPVTLMKIPGYNHKALICTIHWDEQVLDAGEIAPPRHALPDEEICQFSWHVSSEGEVRDHVENHIRAHGEYHRPFIGIVSCNCSLCDTSLPVAGHPFMRDFPELKIINWHNDDQLEGVIQ